MSASGHNERAVRLASLAGDAQIALDQVARGEADAVVGWLAYGAALNEGRSLFPGDREFGQWKAENVLSQVGIAPKADEEVSAMWAAANADQLAEAQAASNARTIRGWHEQWKKIEAEREKAVKEAERKAKAEADRKEAAARAKAAKEEASRQANAAAEARKAAQDAKSGPEKREAEARAEQAAKAAMEAEKLAEEAEKASEPEPEPEPEPDPFGHRKLTYDALAETADGLREAFEEERTKRKKAEAKAKEQKDLLALHEGDKDESIRRLDATIRHQRSQMQKLTEDADAWHRQVNKLKKENSKLRAELERMEIPLN